jgi:hypothetical protein
MEKDDGERFAGGWRIPAFEIQAVFRPHHKLHQFRIGVRRGRRNIKMFGVIKNASLENIEGAKQRQIDSDERQ